MKIVIQVVLWIIIAFLGWQLWTSISEPEKYKEKKIARYEKVIKNLKDIRAAELAHEEITGNYTGSFDSLVRFIDTAKFAITVRRDSSFADKEKNRAYGLDALTGGYFKNVIVVDTLGFASVKDSLYKGSDRYKTMMNIPVEGVDKKIQLAAGKVDKGGTKYSVFEAKVNKRDILESLGNNDLMSQEMQVQSVEGVPGTTITVGSLTDLDTAGNWPKLYDTVNDQ